MSCHAAHMYTYNKCAPLDTCVVYWVKLGYMRYFEFKTSHQCEADYQGPVLRIK